MNNQDDTISVTTIREQSNLANTTTGKNVAIIGGGVAGLTAAHELIERGYNVTVYERRALGGKARSMPVANTGTEGRSDLPGEHGFRIIPKFYHHLPDTLRRIPFAGNTVWNNLVSPKNTLIAITGKPDFIINHHTVLPFPESPAGLLQTVKSWINMLATGVDIPVHELAFIAEKAYVFLTSGDKRRFGQWEKMSWWDYTRANYMSAAYQELISRIIMYLVSARPETASTRVMAEGFEAFFYSYVRRNNDDKYAGIVRSLNLPTNEAWIDPWVNHLTKLGVKFNVGSEITGLTCQNGNIINAQLTAAGGRNSSITMDWFILAVPVGNAISLMSQKMIAADGRLGKLVNLTTDWMNGIQFFLSERTDFINGYMFFIGSPWALIGVTQAQLWPVDFAEIYGDGNIKDILSVDICEWTQPGVLYNKPANQCTSQEIANEVLAQIRNAIDNGKTRLPDSIIQLWFIDPGLSDIGKTSIHNDDPLIINTAGSWDNRPETKTKIDNLFLASDYVRVAGFDLSCMETANESGRNAANAILDVTNNTETHATIFPRYKEPLLKITHKLDDIAYTMGLPNPHDIIHPYFPS